MSAGDRRAAQCIFHHFVFLASAEQHTNRGLFVRLTHIPVQRLQIEGQLAKMFRLKPLYLQFKRNQAVEATMEEEQVQRKVPCPHLYGKLRADEAEISAKLQQEILHPIKQCAGEGHSRCVLAASPETRRCRRL